MELVGAGRLARPLLSPKPRLGGFGHPLIAIVGQFGEDVVVAVRVLGHGQPKGTV
jgi:hypothetical protein